VVKIFTYKLCGGFLRVSSVYSIFLFDVVRAGGEVFFNESRYFSGFFVYYLLFPLVLISFTSVYIVFCSVRDTTCSCY
jgi:hypothetical protein